MVGTKTCSSGSSPHETSLSAILSRLTNLTGGQKIPFYQGWQAGPRNQADHGCTPSIWAIWFIFALVLSNFNVHSSIEPLSGNKRQLNGDENKKKIVRRILFIAMCLSQVSDRPPKIIRPGKFLSFAILSSNVSRFRSYIHWILEPHSKMTTWNWRNSRNQRNQKNQISNCSWSGRCEALESISLEIHVSYIKELLIEQYFIISLKIHWNWLMNMLVTWWEKWF